MTPVGEAQCGRDVTPKRVGGEGHNDHLLQSYSLLVGPGHDVSRQASVVALDEGPCSQVPLPTPSLESCRVEDVPWLPTAGTPGGEHRYPSLFARGVRTIRLGYFEVGGRPHVRQVVLEARAGRADMSASYRRHLLGCRAVQVHVNAPTTTRLRLGGRHPATIDITVDRVVIVVALDGIDKSWLADVASARAG